MKKFLYLLIFFTVSLSAQNSKSKYWLDPEGREISREEKNFLMDKYPDNSLAFRKTKDSGYVYQFNAPKYSTYKVDYKIIKTEIEKITNKPFYNQSLPENNTGLGLTLLGISGDQVLDKETYDKLYEYHEILKKEFDFAEKGTILLINDIVDGREEIESDVYSFLKTYIDNIDILPCIQNKTITIDTTNYKNLLGLIQINTTDNKIIYKKIKL